MLAREDPVPTGLITALLARSRVKALSVTEAIGPSPRQMRELTEGRGLFSPYKLNRVAGLTGVPERRIRAALEGLPELIRALRLRKGREATHARLGPVRIIETDGEVTIETPDGRLITGVHPASFAGPDLLDRFGLAPEPVEGGPVEATGAEQAPLPAGPSEPAAEPEPDVQAGTEPQNETSRISDDKETNLMRPEPAPEPDVSPAPSTPEAAADDPRDRLRALIDRSGRSQAALSRALGKDPSFLNAILTRGRRLPEDLFDRLAPLCEPDGGAVGPGITADPPAEPAPLTAERGRFGPDSDQGGTGPVADQAGPEAGAAEAGIILLDPAPPAEESCMMEVLIEGGYRVRVPERFDMEAAARLIRSLSAGARALEGA
jgi:hypothetical protein